MNSNYEVFPQNYRCKFLDCGPDIVLHCDYVVLLDNGIRHDFSITRLPNGKYSLIHFNDAHQKDKHYTSFVRAYNGMSCIIRRIAKKEAA